MATIPASTAAPETSTPVAKARPQLWQAPVFVLGLSALLTVWLCRPIWSETPQRRFERDLTAARAILSHSNGDLDQAQRHAQRAFDAAEAFPERAGEAALLLGTTHMRRAEGAAPAVALEQWQTARKYLQEADKLGVPEADMVRLVYRLGKVGFHTGEDLALVIQRLESSVTGADNRAECYGLLTQAYLRLPKPDLEKALAANNNLRSVAEASETELATAKLLSGELLLKMGKPEEARKDLKKIGDQAPPAILTKARLLCARSFQDEGKWDEAATLYQAVLADGRAPLARALRPRVLFDLGHCYRRREQPSDAARAWQDCITLEKDSPEGQAAAVLLAEVVLQCPHAEQGKQAPAEKAVELLTQAVARVRQPGDWNNPLLELARAVEVFERTFQALRQGSRFDLALQLTTHYERVAVAPAPLVLRADLSADWARAKQEQADTAEAQRLFRQAASAYADLGKLDSVGEKERLRYLWLGAMSSQAGGDDAQTISKLEAYLKLEKAEARRGEAHFRLAECGRRVGNNEMAQENYRECIQHQTRFAYLARHQLAVAARAAGDLDDAEAILVHNHKLLAFDPDAEALEKTLFTLGELHYQRRNYRAAIRPLAEALHLYKNNPEAVKARYQLADSYRLIASQENQNFLLKMHSSETAARHYQSEHRLWQLKAAEEFTSLGKFLDSPKGKGQLSDEQRLQVPFHAAKCWFYAGEYKKALEIHEALIVRHREKPEELDALGGAIQCHAALGDQNMVRQRLLEIRRALPRHEEAIRQAWERWVEDASRGLGKL